MEHNSKLHRREWRCSRLAAILILLLLLLILYCASGGSDHSCRGGEEEGLLMAALGGARESEEGGVQNSAEIEDLARFAVDEHNKKENSLVELYGVVKAKEQVVAGTLHHLTLEVLEGGEKKLYEAKVWVRPWLNFKELQEFKLAGDRPAPVFVAAADLDDPEEGWFAVSAHDPVVQDAASHAMKTIHERSNSLIPYELLEIIHSKSKVVEKLAKFDMLLKVKRGDNEEKFKVEVHKNLEGTFVLSRMQQEH